MHILNAGGLQIHLSGCVLVVRGEREGVRGKM